MKSAVFAIVPTAGLGKRFSTSVRKPFATVADMPILVYTLKRLHEAEFITEIIPVLRQDDMEMGLELIEFHKLNKIKQIAPGGRERQDSVYNALRLIKKDCLVLIHDGVRPLVSKGLIERLLQELTGSTRTEVDGVVPGLYVKETLKEVDTKGFVLSTVKREMFMAIQTPQIFPFAIIKKAYDKAYKDNFYATDDAALVERIGGRVKIIAGDSFNIKVTTPQDMDMVEYMLTKKKNLS